MSKFKLDESLIRKIDGIYDLRPESELHKITIDQRDYYEQNALIYDDVSNITFAIQNEDERLIRNQFIDWLSLEGGMSVLDLSCGTGADSCNIASKLKGGLLVCADLSLEMLKLCKKKTESIYQNSIFCLANAEHLPFADNTFDRLFSFGGFNVFGDRNLAMREMVRVVKPGGKIIFGDESLPPWLYETEFGKILLNNNELFKYEIPLTALPVEARNVVVRWVIGGVYYLIEFDVGIGEPKSNIDLPIPGKRGGTLRTRYYGKIEGVEPEMKERIRRQADKDGLSIYEWLSSNLDKILGNSK